MASVSQHTGPLDWLELAAPPGSPALLHLHGFGANAADLVPVARRLGAGRLHLLPDAPFSLGGTSRAWHERGGNEQPQTVADMMARLLAWLDVVRARHPGVPMALSGFSQGGAVALRLGLPRPELFRGVAVLSGALRRLDGLTPTLPDGRDQALFVAHGRSDEVVPCDVGRDLVAYLRREGYRPEFRTYAAGHEISLAMLADLEAWLAGVLPG